MNIHDYAAALAKNGFNARVFETGEEAVEAILQCLSPDAVCGIGGSMTVRQLDLEGALQKRGNTVYWHWKKDAPADVFEKAMFSDAYFASANAITQKGTLVNIDGNGNRVAAMFFGPKEVFILAGRNKLTGSYDDAIDRIKNTSCALNARRLHLDTPCARTGKCHDCQGPQRMCRIVVELEKAVKTHPIHVFLINQDLGY